MKFIIEKSELIKSISKVGNAIDPHPVIPYLSGIKITVENSNVTFEASDGDLSITDTLAVKESIEGAALVNGRKFIDVVTKMPNGDITIEIKDNQLFISEKKTKFNLALMVLEQYQPLPEFPPVIGNIQGEELIHAINANAVSVLKGEINPELSGILINIDSKNLTFLSTDRYRLTKRVSPFNSSFPEISKSILVRSTVLVALLKSFEESETVNFAINSAGSDEPVSLFGLSSASTKVTTQVLNAEKYPDVSQLFNSEHSIKVASNIDELKSAIDRALVVASNDQVTFTISKTSINLSSGSNDEASIDETIDATTTGIDENLDITLNSRYVLDGIKQFTKPFVQIAINDSNKPVQICELETADQTKLPEDKYILVPIPKKK